MPPPPHKNRPKYGHSTAHLLKRGQEKVNLIGCVDRLAFFIRTGLFWIKFPLLLAFVQKSPAFPLFIQFMC